MPKLPIPVDTLNYWCTWGVQNFAPPDAMPPPSDWIRPVAKLSEARIFGPGGWSEMLPDDLRRRLILLLDVGWDIAPGRPVVGPGALCGAMAPDPERFPSCSGHDTSGALEQLCRTAKSHGWKGLGLWIACHALGETAESRLSDMERRTYFRERLMWSSKAGIAYWKVDCGLLCGDTDFREMVSEEAARHAPELVIEHAEPCEPASSYPVDWDTPEVKAGPRTGRFADSRLGHTLRHIQELFPISDVIRTYDVTPQLSFATTMDRASELLALAQVKPCRAILNLEDEVYLSAVLGCSFGVMRHPGFEEISSAEYDPLHTRERMAEVRAALTWQEVAPPSPAGMGTFLRSEALLSDTHRFVHSNESWNRMFFQEPEAVMQRAPAVISRGLPILPEVRSHDTTCPFIAASHAPNQALSLGIFPRWIAGRHVHATASVHMRPDRPVTAFAVFGTFKEILIHGASVSVDAARCLNLTTHQQFDASLHLQCSEDGVWVLKGDVLNRAEMRTPDASMPALGFLPLGH